MKFLTAVVLVLCSVSVGFGENISKSLTGVASRGVAKIAGVSKGAVAVKDAQSVFCDAPMHTASVSSNCCEVEVEYKSFGECDKVVSTSRSHGKTRVKYSSGKRVDITTKSGVTTVDYDR